MCAESPCKLTSPQCGCGPNQACSVIGSTRACTPAGPAQVGQACGTGNECGAGAICIAPKTVFSCLKFCSTDADCTAPGGICEFTINDGMGGMVPNAKMCSQNCDPTTNAGCSVTGLGCQAATDMTTMQMFTYCPESGAGGQGASCNTNGAADCMPGYGCFTTAPGTNTCFRWCKVLSPSCPVGSCNALSPPTTIGGTQYGACL